MLSGMNRPGQVGSNDFHVVVSSLVLAMKRTFSFYSDSLSFSLRAGEDRLTEFSQMRLMKHRWIKTSNSLQGRAKQTDLFQEATCLPTEFNNTTLTRSPRINRHSNFLQEEDSHSTNLKVNCQWVVLLPWDRCLDLHNPWTPSKVSYTLFSWFW